MLRELLCGQPPAHSRAGADVATAVLGPCPAGYDRRKYVWKLLYIYMLGYDIKFGHRQAADLIPQPK